MNRSPQWEHRVIIQLPNHSWIPKWFSLEVTNLGTNITDPFWADCNLGSDEANFSEEKKTDLLPTSPALLNWMMILI